MGNNLTSIDVNILQNRFPSSPLTFLSFTGHSSYGSYGHTKGAVAFDMQSGFWLIHSVPRFPAKASTGYQYPSTGLRYGQSMMCVTFDSKLFDPIGRQLVFNHPHIHDNHLPTSFKRKFPHVQKVIKRKDDDIFFVLHSLVVRKK